MSQRVHRVRGNLLTVHLAHPQIKLVVQQLNCYSPRPHGLADTFRKSRHWSWANHYGRRRPKGKLNVCVAQDCDVPGTIVVLAQPPTTTEAPLPYMAGLFGQENMGKPCDYKEAVDPTYRGHLYDAKEQLADEIAAGTFVPPSEPDTRAQRAIWFKRCLVKLAGWMRTPAGKNCKAVAFPHLIGCGLAGGDWAVYEKMITEDLVRMLPADTEVFIVDYDPTTDATVERDLEAASVAWREAHCVSLMMSGSRTWTLPLAPLLDQFVNAHMTPPGAEVTLTHGDAGGADRMCAEAARARGWKLAPHSFQGRLYGKKAGEMLNRDMIQAARPHYLLVFWHNQSGGTRDALAQTQVYARTADTRLRGVFLVQHAGSTAEHVHVDFLPREAFVSWTVGSTIKDLAPMPDATHRVMMTGWRDWTVDVWPFFEQLRAAHPELAAAGASTDVRLHHGAASSGADLLSAAAAAVFGWRVQAHPADWEANKRAAGPIRNRSMLAAAQPHHVVAFVGAESVGTWDALRIVRAFAREAASPLRSVLLIVQDARGAITTSMWTAERFRHATLLPESPHAQDAPQLGFKRVLVSKGNQDNDDDHPAKMAKTQ